MKKTIAIGLMIIVAFSVLNYGVVFVKTAAAWMGPEVSERSFYLGVVSRQI